jgi:hypothetical protein
MSNFIAGRSQNIPEPDAEPEPDDSVEFLEPAEPDDQIKATLAEAATSIMNCFYPTQRSIPKFSHISLVEGLEKSIIERFQIGYSPAYVDENIAAEPL